MKKTAATINLSKIPNNSLIGKISRFPLRFIPKDIELSILQGRLKGKKWISGSSIHGCWLGCYENEKQSYFIDTVQEGSVVYDIGAHVGYYTLLASELVGPKGRVISFEPFPDNVRYLKRHIQINQCDNVTVVESAVSMESETLLFEESGSSYTGSLSEKGTLEVTSVRLDDFISDGNPPPDYMKIDVEGEELNVFFGARSLILKYHPVIFLATHGITVHHQCCALLREMGYSLMSLNKDRSVEETDEIMAFVS